MNLTKIDWFANVGTNINTDFLIPTDLVNEQECIKGINSLRWENLCLYAINRLRWFVRNSNAELATDWNNVVRNSKQKYEEQKDIIIQKADEKNIDKRILIDLKGIVFMYDVENYYKEILNTDAHSQFEPLFKIYQSGHVPCGWKGKLPENIGAEPIDFRRGLTLVW